MPRIDAPTIAEHRDIIWKRLRDSFLEAIEAEGYASLSLAGVARRAGIARNTIYNYAPTKDALLVAVVKSEVEPFVAALVEASSGIDDPEDRLALVVRRQLAALVPGVRGLPIVNMTETMLPAEVSASLTACFAPVLAIVAGIVEQGIAASVFRPVADVPRLVDMMVGVMVAARRAILAGEPPDLIADETTEFLLGGLRGRKTRGRAEQKHASAERPPATPS
ncbi:TetR/AcrR family transcriptional regulator [Polyangium fumosum]|uniref:TetR/AcrR family transcriptional regulator n=1 Tax=Polyangium fumosum TaxID=889272 RepID=A0A4U1JIE1_9BACT|nr:TetR/AcrR family transcriptional regulator [Polyangium fumosum]TKD12264.1 TetR/AcrR family transcriptional regulator [Polyangium fumosum]